MRCTFFLILREGGKDTFDGKPLGNLQIRFWNYSVKVLVNLY